MDPQGKAPPSFLDPASRAGNVRTFRRHARWQSISKHEPVAGDCKRCSSHTVSFAVWNDHAEFEYALCTEHGQRLYTRTDYEILPDDPAPSPV